MQSIIKTLCPLALLLFLSRGTAQPFQIDNAGFFNPGNFAGDTLFVKASFKECGEWGGHAELSKIYLKGGDFFVTYQVFSADCGRVSENNWEPPQTLTKTITKKISNDETLLIQFYFHELADAKLNQPEPEQTGYVFQIIKKRNRLNLWVYTGDDKTKNEYLDFIEKLIG